MMIKRKVLIVHNYYQIPGGEDTVVSNEQELLRQHGHEVLVYTRNNTEIKAMGKTQKLLLPFRTIFNLKTYKDIKKLIKEKEIDVVHVHNTWNIISPSVYYAARICKVPVVQTIHNFRLLCPGATFYRDENICEDCIDKGLGCAVKHACYRNSKLQTLVSVVNNEFHRITRIYSKIFYICLTDFNKSKLLELKQIKEHRVFVKPNFVDSTGKIVEAQNRQDRMIYAGRLDKIKGVDIIFEAWKQMGEKAPELLVCGTGPLEEWCRRFVEENHIENIKFLGVVSNKETRTLIAGSKALILPTQWYEGFPMSIVEAFSVGTPVIGTDIGNVGNLIEDGVTGKKLAENTHAALATAVISLRNSSTDIYSKVYDVYLNKYTAEMNYVQLNTIYDTVCK